MWDRKGICPSHLDMHCGRGICHSHLDMHCGRGIYATPTWACTVGGGYATDTPTRGLPHKPWILYASCRTLVGNLGQKGSNVQ